MSGAAEGAGNELDNLLTILPPLSEEEADLLRSGELAIYGWSPDMSLYFEMLPVAEMHGHYWQIRTLEGNLFQIAKKTDFALPDEEFLNTRLTEDYTRTGQALSRLIGGDPFKNAIKLVDLHATNSEGVDWFYYDVTQAPFFDTGRAIGRIGGPTIDPEFEERIPPMDPRSRAQLEENLVRDGCRDPLITWNGILLDGHNRYEICTRLGIPYKVEWVLLPNRDAAIDWIDLNQLGRRNLSPDQSTIMWGRHYNRMKRQGSRSDLTLGNSCTKSTADLIAEKAGVSPRTVKNWGATASMLAKHPALEAEVIQGKTRLSDAKRAINDAGNTPEKKAQEQALKVEKLRRQLAAAEAELAAFEGGAA